MLYLKYYNFSAATTMAGDGRVVALLLHALPTTPMGRPPVSLRPYIAAY